MKKELLLATLMATVVSAYGQTSTTTSAQTNSSAIGGGASSSVARGGNGGNGAASSSVTVNLGSTGNDPSSGSGTGAQPVANAQQTPSQQPNGTYRESIETVGSPGSMSYGVSFSQFNCANTAGVGAGFMGGAFQIGVGKESDPCNDRANASALYQIATTLATANPSLSAQLYHAAILLIGNSTKETQAALAQAGVSDWAPAPVEPATPITPPPPDVGKANAPPPPVATAPTPASDSGEVIVGGPITVYETTHSGH